MTLPIATTLRRCLPGIGALALFAGACHAQILVSDNFNSGADGSAPAGWTTSSNWKIRTEGGATLAIEGDVDAGTGRPMSKTFAATGKSWLLEFDYAWRWGGSISGNYGYYEFRIDADLVDASGNGYRVRIHQGASNNSANTGRVLELFRVNGSTATLLAQGPGYDIPGWRGLNLTAVNFRKIRVGWDRVTRRLSVWRDVGGGWELAASAVDSAHASFSKLVFNPSAFSGTSVPQIDNVLLTAPAELAWGVGGHPDRPVFMNLGAATQAQKVKDLGATWYRIDARDIANPPAGGSQFDAVKAAAFAQGLKVLPIVYKPLGYPDLEAGTYTNAQLYDMSYAKGLGFGTYYAGQFTHVEVENEMDAFCLNAGADGSSVSHYDATKLARVVAVLKGLGDGIRAGDPNVQRIINTCGWYHYGFLDALVAQGVPFEAVGWHWYSDGGSVQRVMKKLTSYAKPIWVTEFNRKNGAMLAVQDADNFTLNTAGSAPAGWTLSGAWQVDTHGANLVATCMETTGGGGRTMTRALSPAFDQSWSLDFKYAWQWGGSASPAGGAYTLWVDVDMLSSVGNGYRLRVHQGNGNNAANDTRLMELFRLMGGATTLLAQGAGNNEPGWKTRSLAAPDLNQVYFKREASTNTFKASYRTAAGAIVETIDFTDSAYSTFAFDKAVLRADGFPASERPQFDDVVLNTANPAVTGPEQAAVLVEMASEFSSLPGVEALFVYELFDEPNLGADAAEACYGLHRIRRNAGNTAWEIEAARPSFAQLKAVIAARGVLPATGAILVDDSFASPAVTITGNWSYDTALPGGEAGGYLTTAAAAAGTAKVRYSPVIPTAGAYAVSIKVPASASNPASVPVTVRHAGGTASVALDEQTTSGWVWIGDYSFNAGEAGASTTYVEIGNAASGTAIADAVKFHKK